MDLVFESSEARKSRYADISHANNQIYIRQSKSRSDRYAILPKLTLEILAEYWRKCGEPKGLLFPNRNHIDPVSSNIISIHLKNHALILGLDRNISPHMVRHSFTLNLYNDGVDLLTIQKLLGHKSIISTTIYVRLGNINQIYNVTLVKTQNSNFLVMNSFLDFMQLVVKYYNKYQLVFYNCISGVLV